MLTRRSLLKAGAAMLAGAGRHGFSDISGALAAPTGVSLPRPTPAQVTWQDCEVGVIYHFDLPIAAGVFAPNNAVPRRLDPTLYNPAELNTDQWLEAAKAAGARYALFTATHFNGFMQWQSDLYPYGVKQSPWRGGKGDVVGDFVASCHKANIRPGIYLSTHRNAYWNVLGHYVDRGKGKDTDAQKAFCRVAEKMVEELCSRYGPLVQIWFDAGVKIPQQGGPDVLPIFEKHQPDAVFYHSAQRADYRWIGNEHGEVPYPCWAAVGPKKPRVPGHKAVGNGDPNGNRWSPAMVDVPLRGIRPVHNWFWNPNQDHAVYPVESLVEMYYDAVGGNCNLILGEVVTPKGLVPESDIRRLAEFGKEIRRRFAAPLAKTQGRGNLVELSLPAELSIDQAVIMEAIAQGERVRKYVLEGRKADGQWHALGDGQAIGHKRIQRFAPVEVSAARLRILESVAEPVIRQLAVYKT